VARGEYWPPSCGAALWCACRPASGPRAPAVGQASPTQRRLPAAEDAQRLRAACGAPRPVTLAGACAKRPFVPARPASWPSARRVQRLWREEGLRVPCRRPKRALLAFTGPGCPWQDAWVVESFNGRPQDELLDRHQIRVTSTVVVYATTA